MLTNTVTQAEPGVEQHALGRSIVLHLLPGVLILTFYLIFAPLMGRLGLPSGVALFTGIGVVLIPFELGILLYQGKMRNGRLSLDGIVVYREPVPWWQTLALAVPLFLWSGLVFLVVAPPVDQAIIDALFAWVPDWFFLFPPNEELGHLFAELSRPALLVTVILYLTMNGIAGPVVEELYFRGYLLPRLARFKGWAPLINALLFSLYHFFTPWQNAIRIIVTVPMVYAVWWKRNIYVGMIAHCAINTVGGMAMLALALGAG
jgi:membrane protease YdiL (CAAX protease family)